MELLLPYLICVCFLSYLATAQTNKNVTLGSSLQAGEPTASWASPSKHFAFGFQEIEPGNFLLAIWFDRIPEKTITWSANRNHPALSGSKVELTAEGLVLTDPNKHEIWKAKLPTGNRIAYAAMLDTGNFVLVSQASAVLWQSFDEPTDTLLPTQTLSLGGQLLACLTEKNYSATNGSSILGDMFPAYESENQALYQRVILEYDGVLRHYVYRNQSSDSSRGWSSKSFIPDNICPAVMQYTDDEMSGCFQNFLPQSCEKEASHEKNQFDFKFLKNVDWPLADYEHFQNVSIDWCREICLMDCFCAVGIFRGKETGDCWKKSYHSQMGKSDNIVDRTAFIKYYNHWVYFFAYRKNPKIVGNYNVRCFSYKELDEATNKFNEELGRGAFGVVYKGVLSNISGSQTFIAVKKLNSLTQDADNEFKTEVNSIGRTHHKNLVKLLGYCEEEKLRLLVYEFMSNGNLFVSSISLLSQLGKRGCELLRTAAPGSSHCDIKPHNILLDENHNARISDFGLAKLLRLDQTHTNTAPRGTTGYVAPEWSRTCPLQKKWMFIALGFCY
ncbi:G-type lectin S-receptor-like serine/threonine-protein kinase LECRK4 [Bienertia sinuspersici]